MQYEDRKRPFGRHLSLDAESAMFPISSWRNKKHRSDGMLDVGAPNVSDSVQNVEGKIEEVDGQIKEMDGQIKEMDGQIKEMDGQIKEMDRQIEGVDALTKEVDAQTKEVDAQTKEVDAQVKEVQRKIDEHEKEANMYSEILSSEEQFMKAWANLSGFLKRQYESEDRYYNFLNEKIAHLNNIVLPELKEEKKQLRKDKEQLRKDKEQLRKEKEQLRKEKEQLHKEKEQLRKKEEQLRKREEQLRKREEQLRKERILLLEENRLQELSELPVKFDAGNRRSIDVNFKFDYVQTSEFGIVLDIMRNTVEMFRDTSGIQGETHFKFPVVDGAAGTGKSRLCWEVSNQLANEYDGVHLFFDCHGLGSKYGGGDERNKENCAGVLASILFDRLVNTELYRSHEFSLGLGHVLEKIKKDLGSKVVVLQVDEYGDFPAVTRMILRGCRDVMFRGPESGSGVVVVPVLSGIAYTNIRDDLTDVTGDKFNPSFLSLCGISAEKIRDLWDVFDRSANLGRKSIEIKNLALILSTFGGYPRVFEWLLGNLNDMKHTPIIAGLRNGNLSSNDAKLLYDAVRGKYDERYGFSKMAECLRTNPATGVKNRIRSDRTHRRTEEYLKRIHTLAITGHKVDIHYSIWKDMTVDKDDNGDDGARSLLQLSTSGLFTLTVEKDGKGTVYVPLIAIDSCCSKTGIGYDGMLSPFGYSWNWMEVVAMVSLRCRWNSLWYSRDLNRTGPYVASVSELRPGALFNQEWIKTAPTVEIDRELPHLVMLANPFKGDKKTEFPTGVDGKGSDVLVADRSIFLMSANETGNDGGAIFEPFAWLTQCKSRDILAERGTDLTQKSVSNIQAAQAKAASVFDFGKETKMVIYDIFTNRREGARLDPTLIPDNTFVTSMSNIEAVAGPVFWMSKRLFEDTEND